jgi:hypothetical protein
MVTLYFSSIIYLLLNYTEITSIFEFQYNIKAKQIATVYFVRNVELYNDKPPQFFAVVRGGIVYADANCGLVTAFSAVVFQPKFVTAKRNAVQRAGDLQFFGHNARAGAARVGRSETKPDYLDGQPLWLPAQYGDKVACYYNKYSV